MEVKICCRIWGISLVSMAMKDRPAGKVLWSLQRWKRREITTWIGLPLTLLPRQITASTWVLRIGSISFLIPCLLPSSELALLLSNARLGRTTEIQRRQWTKRKVFSVRESVNLKGRKCLLSGPVISWHFIFSWQSLFCESPICDELNQAQWMCRPHAALLSAFPAPRNAAQKTPRHIFLSSLYPHSVSFASHHTMWNEIWIIQLLLRWHWAYIGLWKRLKNINLSFGTKDHFRRQ